MKEKPYQPTEEEIKKAEEIMTDEQKKQSLSRETEFHLKDNLHSNEYISWPGFCLEVSEEDKEIIRGFGVTNKYGYDYIKSIIEPDYALECLDEALEYSDTLIKNSLLYEKRCAKLIEYWKGNIHEIIDCGNKIGSDHYNQTNKFERDAIANSWIKDLERTKEYTEIYRTKKDKIGYLRDKILKIKEKDGWKRSELAKTFKPKQPKP